MFGQEFDAERYKASASRICNEISARVQSDPLGIV